MAEDHADFSVRIHQRQSQPKLEDMGLLPRRHRHHALGRTRAFKHLLIGRLPIVTLIAEIKIGHATTCRLDAHVVAQPRAGKADPQLQRLRPDNIEQAQGWQGRLQFSGLNVTARRKTARRTFATPIIIKGELFGNNELGSDSLILRCQGTSPSAPPHD